MERVTEIQVRQGEDLNTRLLKVLKQLNYPNDLGNDPRYGQLTELQLIRNAIEHPDQTTIYNHEEANWDKVPLAWVVSGKAIRAYAAARSLVNEVIQFWSDKKEEFERPGTLNVQRGIRSLHPVKKTPPTKR